MATSGSSVTTFDQYAIQIINANTHYKNKTSKKTIQVFSHLNLTVPVGAIYGLLGPSGAGKTTILRCILGSQKVDKGYVFVFGHSPGSEECGIPGRNVGYMPQETCIFDTMTIAECLRYFGKILGVSSEKIDLGITKYTELLQLPPKATRNSTLSGGQGRRVSLAIALLHEPKLLILDEPTVGIDPILKERIWNHLIKLVKTNQTTVVLTTHYIEEAQKSDVIGMLQDGRMVAENTVANLMSQYSCTTLENVFLKLCEDRNHSTLNNNRQPVETNGQFCSDNDYGVINVDGEPSDVSVNPKRSVDGEEQQKPKGRKHTGPMASVRTTFTNRKFFKLNCIRKDPLKSIIFKYIIFLVRFPGALFFVLFLPSIFMTMNYITLGKPLISIGVNVVNEDEGHLGNIYISTLHCYSKLKQMPAETLVKANEFLWNGLTFGVIHIRKNFSHSLTRRIEDGPFAGQEVLSKEITLHVDNTNLYIHQYIIFQVYMSFEQFFKVVSNSSTSDSFIKFNQEMYDYLDSPTLHTVDIRFLVNLTFCIGTSVAVLLLFIEIRSGYLERSFISGATPAETVCGLLVVMLTGMFGGVLLQLIVFWLTIPVGIQGSMLLIYMIVCTVALCGLAYGLFLSLYVDQVITLVIIAANTGIIACALNGCFWPMEAAPATLQLLCKVLPFLYPVKALDAIVYKGEGFLHQDFMLALLVLLVWMLLFFAMSIRRLHLLK